ncbi:MAG TPA: XdhC/CoxI family protein [Pedobacter sp.]|uniref:XdhC family protein n=1 Tax=Pedobacter sp. TaxID=1411316 RepID=UPI002B7A9347|nr:XdhC/CoxI family protein [Pedobacter sp.]HMI05651.1 XdhC/CoxI family protein [Pedobacter sp.]
MKEISAILKSFEKAEKKGKKTALATVVHVEGSSYRRPGARMLITEDGELTGAISGGCLEGDALRKALSAIVQQQNKLVTYDTTDEDDAKLGIQLGCNGVVHILFEPIVTDQIFNPIRLLQELANSNEDSVMVTLFSLDQLQQPGTSLLYRNGLSRTALTAALQSDLVVAAEAALQNKSSDFRTFQYDDQAVTGFIEFIPAPLELVIAGAGNDVQPLVDITSVLGWHTTVVDGRASHATAQRFVKADRVLVAKPDEVLKKTGTGEHTFFVLMTHNYNYDLALLKQLIIQNCAYIGVLGPKKKLQRMLDELSSDGVVPDEKQLALIHGPVGLDIGAETAEEIAVSIVAEINTVLRRRSGTSLKDKEYGIHSSLSG